MMILTIQGIIKMKVRDILIEKGPQVLTIGENKLIIDAINFLANNQIGALLVIAESGKLTGIITERDIIKAIAGSTDVLATGKVCDYMTKKLIFIEPDDELEYIESIFVTNRIRHLPVMHNSILVGIVSIGDTVKAQVADLRTENKYLYNYISGTTPKG